MTQAKPGADDHDHRWWRPDGPWPWLIYLPLFFRPWLHVTPSPPKIAGATVGLVVFLALHLRSFRQRDRTLALSATAVLLLSFLLYWTGGAWSVVSVYSAYMLGRLRPFRLGVLAVLLATLAIALFGLATRQPFNWWSNGCLISLVIGVGTALGVSWGEREQALRSARDEVRRIAEVAEHERMVRDLHDLLGRTLTLIAVKADLAKRLAQTGDPGSQRELDDIATAARDGLQQVRSALSGDPGVSLPQEIAEAKRALQSAGIAVEANGVAAVASSSCSAILAMVLREAVTNVIRHAEAKHCLIQIGLDGRAVRLEVRDDGCGGPIEEGRGLSGMRARLAAAGGALDVVSGSAGTRLVASLEWADA